jgi:hypothetical protein
MFHWLLVVIGILLGGLVWYSLRQHDSFYNYDWSSGWSELDAEARKDADCTPIVKIQRKMGDLSTWIWTMPKSCEQGLPHTRAIDVIAIPENFPAEKLPVVLEHEKIHLLQRQMPDSWARFYKLAWDYDVYTAPPAGMPAELVELKRANPDTADSPWPCWRGHWWPVAVYPSRKNLSLSGAPIKWWNSQDGTIRISPPEDWIQFFGRGVHQNEHPHEIAAEYLSGPLRNAGLPAAAPEGMIRLRNGWTDASTFPSVDS